LVLVTGETKSDWWHRSGDEGIYPRYELVDEYRRHSNGQSFHVVPLSVLLEKVGASKETVEDVRREELEVSRPLSLSAIVKDWPLIRSQVKASGNIGRRVEALLQQTDPVAVIARTVVLATPYEFHRNRLSSVEVTEVIISVLEALYGGPMNISVTSHGTDDLDVLSFDDGPPV